MVGSRCPSSDGDIAFAPVPELMRHPEWIEVRTLVRSDGTKAEALPPIEALAPGAIVENQLAWSPDGLWLIREPMPPRPRIVLRSERWS